MAAMSLHSWFRLINKSVERCATWVVKLRWVLIKGQWESKVTEKAVKDAICVECC